MGGAEVGGSSNSNLGWLKTPARDGGKYFSFSTFLFGSLFVLALLYATNFMSLRAGGAVKRTGACVLRIYNLYQHSYSFCQNFTKWEYLFLGLVSALPTFIIPIILVGKADSSLCWKDRYWVKANLWVMLFSYVGNYFWTHYFFTVLGASYTFPSWKMNNVPHTTFLLTHVCVLFYHVSSNMTLCRIQHSIAHLPEKTQFLFKAAWILALSYFVAHISGDTIYFQ